jgi:hypothetical protein
MDGPKPVKLAAKLPKEVRLNGLETVHDQLAKFGTATIIATVTTKLVEQIGGGGVLQPVMLVEHVEGLPTGPLAKAGERLMTRARIARLGGEEEALPIEFDQSGEDDD